MYQFVRLAGVLLPMTFLLACGGGGGGGGGTAAPLPDFPVSSTAQARSLTGGMPPPSLSSAQIEQVTDTRVEASDTLLVSNVLAASGGTTQRLTPSCSGTVCSNLVIDGGTITLDLFNQPEGRSNRRAVMVKNGVTLAEAVLTESDGDQHQSYGGWLDGSIFAVSAAVFDESLAVLAGFSAGNDSGSNPTGTGSAAWSGIMVGAFHRSISRIDVIQGDASIDIDDLSSPDVDVAFTDIKNLDARSDVDAMSWSNLVLNNGAFAAVDGSIEGAFYGANHEEVGGAFDRNNIIGSFGASRVTTPFQ